MYDCVTVKVGSDRPFTLFHIEIITEGETESLVGWQTDINALIGKQRDF